MMLRAGPRCVTLRSQVMRMCKASTNTVAPRACARRNVATSAAAADTWAEDDNRRMLHAVYRVNDLDETIDYYKQYFGMDVVRFKEYPTENYSNAYLAYGPESTNFAVELTYNYGVDSYDLGAGFGHFGLVTDDVYKMCDSIKEAGGKVTREPGPVKGGKTNIAFVEDPTGYKWELIEREQPTQEPLCQVMLRVSDLDAAIEYYKECLGMTLLRKRVNEKYKYTLAFMGYGPEEDNTVIELTYNWGVDEPYGKGTAYAQVTLGTDDVQQTVEAVRAAGGKIIREPDMKDAVKSFVTVDPDGWKYVFVDNKDFLAQLE